MKISNILTGVLSICILAVLLGFVSTQPVKLPSIEGACTSLLLDNDGQALFATNYDNLNTEGILFVNPRGVAKYGWEAGTTGKYPHWIAKYGSLTFNLAGPQVPWAGMNEAGLTISTMWLGETRDPIPDERPPLLASFWVQYQLDTSATLEEVIANDARVRIHGAVDHYLVCDRTGDCAAVEFLQGKTFFHRTSQASVSVLTNNLYLDSVSAWQTEQLRGNALERFGMAAERAAAFEPGDASSAVAYAFETLDLVSGQATGGTPTQWSIIFDMHQLQVYFKTNRIPQIRSVDFSNLDFNCGKPLQILDINAPLTGEVSDDLGPLSFRSNLARTIAFLEQWGESDLELSNFEVEVLERGVSSFACRPAAAFYQDARTQIIPPLAGWVALALLHRYWPIVAGIGAGGIVLVAWRMRARSRNQQDKAK
jgi:penicillin V acylase-like amidase (Ntn superfamily)